MLDAVTTGDGRAFFADAPEYVSLNKKKVSKPLFAAVVRLGIRSKDIERCWSLAKGAASTLSQYEYSGSNTLIPLENNEYPTEVHELDLLYRRTHRYGMLLNSEELVSLAHLPSSSVRSDKLYRDIARTKESPSLAVGNELALGINYHRGETTEVTVSSDQRLKHTYVIGTSGTGKSTLLLNMIIQDIERGNGIAVLDPHGDLIHAYPFSTG